MAGRAVHPVHRFGAALAAVAAATAVRSWLDRALHGDLPFATYFAAVAFAAWYGGAGPGLVALLLGAIAPRLFVPAFPSSFGASIYGAAVYFVVGGAMILFSETLRRAQTRSEATAAEARRERSLVEETQRRFETLAAHAPVGIFETDAAGSYLYVNRRWREITGVSPDVASGPGWIDAIDPTDREDIIAAWSAFVARGTTFGCEYRLRSPAGTVTWVAARAVALRDTTGAVSGHLGTLIDVTETKRAARRAAAQHAATRVLAESGTLVEAAPRILAAVCECLEWEWGALWVIDDGADVLRCAEAWHPPEVTFPEFEAASRARTFAPGIGLPGRVWQTRQPAWVPDIARDDNFPRAPIAARDGLHGALGFPILLGGTVLGVLEFFSREIRQPDADLHGMLLSIGSQIGQFMERRDAEARVHASEARKGAILEAALDSIVSIDAHGRITEFNPAAERTFGYRRADILGRSMAELIIPRGPIDEDRRSLERFLATGDAELVGRRIEFTARRSDGSEFLVELAITRIVAEGEPGFTAYLRDITERKRAEHELQTASQRSEFLARTSAVLASMLDYAETLAALAHTVVPFLADWCSVDVLEPDGTVRRLAVAHADAAKADLARLASVYPPDPDARHPRTAVLRTGRSVLIPDVTDEGLVRIADTPEQLGVLRAVGYRSAMFVALTARGQTLGALTFATAESGRRYGRDDLAFAEEVARRAAVAVDNARLYRDAQEASRTKDEFLATVSHELRTPLQAMLGWVAVLRQGKVGAERRVQALDIIERAGRAQAKLIDDLLDVSRIVTGRLHLDVGTTDLVAVIEDALDTVRPAAAAKDIALVATLDRTTGPISGDSVRLQQVVSNLLSNAIKFTPSGGRADVRLERGDGEIRIVVSDTGQGIRPDFLPHVFEPFRQAESAGRRREAGLGLGLAIVRRVVELHGGRVTAHSEGEGRGTTIIVTLPWRAAAGAVRRSG